MRKTQRNPEDHLETDSVLSRSHVQLLTLSTSTMRSLGENGSLSPHL